MGIDKSIVEDGLFEGSLSEEWFKTLRKLSNIWKDVSEDWGVINILLNIIENRDNVKLIKVIDNDIFVANDKSKPVGFLDKKLKRMYFYGTDIKGILYEER